MIEKKYFLKNANIYDEIQKSKYTYSCCNDKAYERFDIICGGYELLTPNMILEFFDKNPDANEIVIRIMTDEHIKEFITEKKINLQVFKMLPFKHFKLSKEDFYNVYNEVIEQSSEVSNLITECNKKITDLKEIIKENKKSMRFNKTDKEKQLPYKEHNERCKEEINALIEEIKSLSEIFSNKIKEKLVEVLRSHWSGETIETGHFDLSKGRVTDNLVGMIIMLIDQFAKSGNWSGYTYIDDMKGSALVQLYDVVLKFEELKSNNPFAYLTTVASMKFTAILNAEKTQRKMKSRMLQDMGYNPTFNEMAEMDYALAMEDWGERYNPSSEQSDDIDTENMDIDETDYEE